MFIQNGNIPVCLQQLPAGEERRKNSRTEEEMGTQIPDSRDKGAQVLELILLQCSRRKKRKVEASSTAQESQESAIRQYCWPSCLADARAPLLN